MDISPLLTQCIRRILKQHLLTGLLVGSLLISDEALAANYSNSYVVMPGATVAGLAGRNIVGQFDSMVPTLGNSNGFIYLDPQFSFHQGPDYSGAFGLGGRYLSEQFGILGAYVFADYDHSPNSNHFWFVSPGVELLADRIDFSANAYIPVSSRQKFLEIGVPGTQVGINQFVSFHGHNQFDALFRTSESVGFGADAQLAYRLPIVNNPKFYVGSYYANPKDAENHIWGGVVGVDVPVTDAIRVGVSEAYDNLDHNTVKLALSVDLGGRHTHKNYNKLNRQDRLASRMVDPIQRNLILVGGSSVTNQPIVQNAAKIDESALVRSNISFFEPLGTDPGSIQDGTFENPYQGLTQGHVNDANRQDNRNFFFNSGKYVQNNVIQFINDSIYGRQTFNGLTFALPAVGATRPLFDFSHMSTSVTDAFQMTTTKDTTIDAITMLGNNASTGIDMTVSGRKPIDVIFSHIDLTHFGSIHLNVINVQNTGNIKNFLLTDAVITDNNGIGLNIFNSGANTVMGNVLVSSADISNNAASGIVIDNSSAQMGNVTLSGVIVNNNNLVGLNLQNVNNSQMGNVSLSAVTANNNGEGLLFNNQNSQMGNVSLSDVTVNNSSGTGFALENTIGQLGNVSLNDVTVNNTGAVGFAISNFNGQMGNVTLSGLTANNNASSGLLIDNNGNSIGDISVFSSDISNNANTGVLILNFDTIHSITFDALTAMNNVGGDLDVDNSVGTITTPHNEVTVINSTIGAKTCLNCVFIP